MSWFLNFLILISIGLCFVNGQELNDSETHQKYAAILSHIRSNASESQQQIAAIDVIKRTIPNRANEFNVTIDFSLTDNSYKILKRSPSEAVSIVASSGVAACKAFYQYIKYYCNGHISWEGSQLNLPKVLPMAFVEHRSPSRFVYYQNVCTWSYSFAWWKWADWQKHIDWIAMQGITLTLAPIQENVWAQIYAELGLTDDEIDDHIAGPAFLAWQRMGNIRGWGGPPSKYFLRFSDKLQMQIIHGLRSLGIAVALPAFAGHVPRAFQRIFPNSTLTQVDQWNRFSDQYCCPLFIDPVDPLFQKIGQLFLKKVIQRFGGTNHIYFSDPFNEIQPRLADPSYLAQASRAIYETIASVDAKGVWLLQGWMFVKNPFWSDKLIESFLTAPPLGRILVLDLQSEQSPQYERTQSFYGQPFIWCMLHNFGGTLGMHGSVHILNTKIKEASEMANSTMFGVGITPEGINQNYVIYEFALEKAWDYIEVDAENWFRHYSFVRYGHSDNNAKIAWNKLLNSVYDYRGNETIRGKYIICKRPSLDLRPMNWYDSVDLTNAWKHLLLAADNLQNNSLYKHDVVDVTRQYVQMKIDNYYIQLIDAFRTNDIKLFTQIAQQWTDILLHLDLILGSNEDFLLGKWLSAAKNLGINSAERQLYEISARNQITTWGPNGEIVDYAMKQWSGMIVDYCLPRWQLFFETVQQSLSKGQKINMSKLRRRLFADIENPFTVATKVYPTQPVGDTIELATMLYSKYMEKNIAT